MLALTSGWLAHVPLLFAPRAPSLGRWSFERCWLEPMPSPDGAAACVRILPTLSLVLKLVLKLVPALIIALVMALVLVLTIVSVHLAAAGAQAEPLLKESLAKRAGTTDTIGIVALRTDLVVLEARPLI